MDHMVVICNDKDRLGNGLPVRCNRCDIKLIISPATRRDVPLEAEILCIECAFALLGPEGVIQPPGPNQIAELGPEATARIQKLMADPDLFRKAWKEAINRQ